MSKRSNLYANQVKHSKVHGPPPGKELHAESYSPQELAEELGVALSTVYEIIKRCHIETFEVDTWMRIPKDSFRSGFYINRKINMKFEVKIMASIVHRNNRFLVVHYEHDISGKNKQKWETYRTLADAKRRKAEIEHRQELGALDVPTCKTVNDLLKEYISLYGKATWSLSVFSSNSRLIRNYISPVIGKMDMCEISPRILEKYYQKLLQTPAVSRITQKRGTKDTGLVQPATVRKIHSLLRSAFNQAVKWELMEKNPAIHATVPKAVPQKREVWDAETIFLALDVCDDARLKLAINLSFACSMRIGEILGLTWDCVDISPKSIADGTASIIITKELQRVDKTAMKSLEQKDVLFIFPSGTPANNAEILYFQGFSAFLI